MECYRLGQRPKKATVLNHYLMNKRLKSAQPLKLFIVEWREQRGLSQDALAERVGTTKASISRWETGKRDVTGESLAAIAAALGLEPVLLFRHPKDQSLDDLLSTAPSELRRKAVAIIQALLTEDSGQLNVYSVPTKAKH